MSNENRNKPGKRIAPGIWEDKDGNVHFSLPELLALFDLEDTPENRATVTKNLKEMLHEQCPEATIVERPMPD